MGNHRDNLRLDSLDEAIDEASRFRDAGGDTIVDVTPKNSGSDPQRLRTIAHETGLNIVHGTAYYNLRNSEHPERLYEASIDEIAGEFVSDVREGIGNTDVRAGLIGEIGLSNHIEDQQEKVLRAGARAARRTGAPLTVHPPGATRHSQKNRTYPASRWGLDILDIVEEEGLAPDRVIIDHQDRSRWYENLEYQKEIAERGAYVEYDLINAKLVTFKEEHEDAYPSDSERVEYIMDLIEAGHGSNVLLSQDVYNKIHLPAYGGYGYMYILENFVPILRSQGVDEGQITELLVDNPRRVLTFAEPE
jgi:phosphotriesterase-related protein